MLTMSTHNKLCVCILYNKEHFKIKIDLTLFCARVRISKRFTVASADKFSYHIMSICLVNLNLHKILIPGNLFQNIQQNVRHCNQDPGAQARKDTTWGEWVMERSRGSDSSATSVGTHSLQHHRYQILYYSEYKNEIY